MNSFFSSQTGAYHITYAYHILCIITSQKNPLLRTCFTTSQLLDCFLKLIPKRQISSWQQLADQKFYSRAFTPLITLWYLVFQRLSDNHSLSHIVEDAREGGADRLSPRHKPLSKKLRSEATTSYSDARQRLPLDLCCKVLRHTGRQIMAWFRVPKSLGFKVGLMDGSTLRMRPDGDIPKQFSKHSGNTKKRAYWCLSRVVGILCQATGVVLDCAMGPTHISEQALSAQLMSVCSWKGWLLVGDRNFGVYSVARATRAAQAHGLFRLTRVRAAKLARLAGVKLRPGLDVALNWTPTRHDKCPEGLKPNPVPGRLIAIPIKRRGHPAITLYLFTTLADPQRYPVQELVEIYAQRWSVELCFRYIKSEMDLGFLECRSAQMVRKEWIGGLIAYNLIRAMMAAAAAIAKVPVQCLSFSRTRELLLGWLLRKSAQLHAPTHWHRLLARISKARLPKRRKPRPSEPRAKRPFNSAMPKLEGSRAAARRKLRHKS